MAYALSFDCFSSMLLITLFLVNYIKEVLMPSSSTIQYLLICTADPYDGTGVWIGAGSIRLDWWRLPSISKPHRTGETPDPGKPLSLPNLKLNPEIMEIDRFSYDDIMIENYTHHEHIRAPISV